MFAAFLCTVLFSVSSIFGHRSAKMIGGTEANFWRLSVALLLLGIWSFGFGAGLTGAGLSLLVISGMIGIGLGDVALFQALPRLGAPLCSLLTQCFVVPLGALIEWILLGTRLSPLQFGCILVILTGVGITLAPGEHVRLSRKTLVAGLIFCFAAALGTALGAVLSRKAYELANASGEAISGIDAAFQRIFGGLIIAGICLLAVKRRAFRIQSHLPYDEVVKVSQTKWKGVWTSVLINGIAGQTLGVSCMQWALTTTPTPIVLAIITLTPIVMLPVAYFLDGDRPATRSVIGGALAVVGAIGLSLFR